MRETNWRDHWQAVKAKNASTSEVTIRIVASRVQVVCPQTPEWKLEARKLGGRWRWRTGMWSFQLAQQQVVRELCSKLFSTNSKTVRPKPMSRVTRRQLQWLMSLLSRYNLELYSRGRLDMCSLIQALSTHVQGDMQCEPGDRV